MNQARGTPRQGSMGCLAHERSGHRQEISPPVQQGQERVLTTAKPGPSSSHLGAPASINRGLASDSSCAETQPSVLLQELRGHAGDQVSGCLEGWQGCKQAFLRGPFFFADNLDKAQNPQWPWLPEGTVYVLWVFWRRDCVCKTGCLQNRRPKAWAH